MQAEYVAVPLVSEQERIAAILDEPNGRGGTRPERRSRPIHRPQRPRAGAAAGGALKEPLRRRQNFERIQA